MPALVWSHLAAFLVGSAAGVVGKYVADRLTDARRKKEVQSADARKFAEAEARCSKLIADMQRDVREPKNANIRRLFLRDRHGGVFNLESPAFMYYETDYDNLAGQLHILEGHNYIVDVTATGKNTKQYRMSETFVRLLLAE